MRRVFLFLLILMFFVNIEGIAENNWRLGIFNIKSDDKVGSSLANSIKRSSLLILSKDFETVDIISDFINKERVLRESVKSKVDFSIYGFISKKEKDYSLILELVDIGNKEVKVSREYSLVYEEEKVFDTIDSIVSDFREGVKKVIPKYDEEIALEIRRKIEQREMELKIPGEFSINLSLRFVNLSDRDGVIYPSIKFLYVNNTGGGIFGNGWFVGFEFPDMINRISLYGGSRNFFSGKEISIFTGTKLFSFLGVGVDFLFVKGIIIKVPQGEGDNSIDFLLRPFVYLNFGNISALITPTFFSENGVTLSLSLSRLLGLGYDRNTYIMDYLGSKFELSYKINKEISITGIFGIEMAKDNFYQDGSVISVGIGVSRMFYF